MFCIHTDCAEFLGCIVWNTSLPMSASCVTIGLFEYKKVPTVNITFAQTLEAIAERAAPMIHLNYESSQLIGSQITYLFADWLEYKKILPHAPIYGVSVVGYSFRTRLRPSGKDRPQDAGYSRHQSCQ
jgi:hypothetical protein